MIYTFTVYRAKLPFKQLMICCRLERSMMLCVLQIAAICNLDTSEFAVACPKTGITADPPPPEPAVVTTGSSLTIGNVCVVESETVSVVVTGSGSSVACGVVVVGCGVVAVGAGVVVALGVVVVF